MPETTLASAPVLLTETSHQSWNLRRQHVAPCDMVMAVNTAGVESFKQGRGPFTLAPDQQDALVVLDFGEERVGRLTGTFLCDRPTRLQLQYGEDLEQAVRSQEYGCGWYVRPRDLLTLPKGTTEVAPGRRRGFRYVALTVAAGDGPVHVESIGVQTEAYPVVERGQFKTSDEQLNGIWDLCQRTTRLCMQDYYEDGVNRDGLLWIGDYRIQFLCNALTFGDTALAAKSLALIALSGDPSGALPANAARSGGHRHPTDIDYMPGLPGAVADWVLPNYLSEFPGALREYLLYSGDVKLVRALWPTTCAAMQWLLTQLDIDNLREVLDYLTDNQFDVQKGDWWGSRGAFFGMLTRGFRDFEWLANWLGDESSASQARAGVARFSTVLREHYRDPSTGLFQDHPDGWLQPRRLSWHAQVQASLAGLAGSGAESLCLLERIAEYAGARHPVSGYAHFWHCEALFRAGWHARAIDEIRAWHGWHLQQGESTCWERLDLVHGERPWQDSPTSHCHGWSAGPCYLLPTWLLGVAPLEVGMRRIRIAPRLCGLDWIHARIPTPLGEVEIEVEGKRSTSGRIRLPAGIRASYRRPDGTELEWTSGEHTIH